MVTLPPPQGPRGLALWALVAVFAAAWAAAAVGWLVGVAAFFWGWFVGWTVGGLMGFSYGYERRRFEGCAKEVRDDVAGR
ncbi:MAG: hypothetical protein KGL53_06735, partial [Elusimicrobia bacterium]|nr:hypothetical protein [Elusimicrobiota bacterium]